MLASQGGLIDESHNIFPHFGAWYKVQAKEWIFKNGAMLKFVAMPKDSRDVQGWQPTNVIIDEAAEYSLKQVLAIQERVRSGRFKGKTNMMLTCNPNRNSFLYEWVEWCLDPDTGIPRAGTENVRKWVVILNGKCFFGNSVEELYKEHGGGKVLGDTFIPMSFRFIPMTLEDNPVLIKNNPGYKAKLLNATRVSQLRYLYGSWTAIEEGASYFQRAWTPIVQYPPENVVARVRAWDLAHSTPTETSNPDWTAGVLISRTSEGIYYIEDVVRFRELTDKVIKNIVSTAEQDGLDVPVCIPQDSGSGKSASFFFNRYFAENGLTIIPISVHGHSGKLKRFLPFASLCENGSVRIVKGPWNEIYLTELERFDNTRNIKDDQVDATADGFNTIARRAIIPHFTIPDLRGYAPIAKL
jgi:predicted phage terminase large subunit-like protein